MIQIGDFFRASDAETKECICQGRCTQIKNSTDIFGRRMYAISPDNVHFFTVWSPHIYLERIDESTLIPCHDISKYVAVKWKYQIAYDIEDVDIYLEDGYNEIDLEVKPLVYELNQWEGIETTQSCCGHDKGHLWVKFYVRNFQSLNSILLPLRSDGSPLLDEFSLEIGSKLTEASIIHREYKNCNHHDGIELTLVTFSKGLHAYDIANKYTDALRKIRGAI